jgi:hypothetical protein
MIAVMTDSDNPGPVIPGGSLARVGGTGVQRNLPLLISGENLLGYLWIGNNLSHFIDPDPFCSPSEPQGSQSGG